MHCMESAAWRLRGGSLVLAGALVLHELRYVLVGQHQDPHAHAYLGWLVPALIATLALAVIEFAIRLTRGPRGRTGALASAGVRWLAVSSLLVCIFAVQESAEMLLSHGRLDIADSLVVHGAWVAMPLAFVLGAAIALLLRGAAALLARCPRRKSARTTELEATRSLPRPRRPRLAVLACHLAGRAPPRLA